MIYALITTFIIGYAIIALEHPLKINKTATALILGAMWYCRESTELESNSSEVKSQLHHLLFKKKKIKKQITSFLPGFDVLIYILVMSVHSSKDAVLAHDRGSVCWFQQERSVTLCLPDIFFFFPVGRTGLCQLQWIP